MRHIHLYIFCLLFSMRLSAQSTLDWILDPVGSAESYITTQVNNVAHEAWEGFLDDDIKSSLSEDAQKIAKYEIDSSRLKIIDKQYEQHTYGEANYGLATEKLGEILQKFIYVTPKGNFQNYANGTFAKEIQRQATEIKSTYPPMSRLSLFFQTHPELEDLNNRWRNVKGLHDNIPHLYYWGILSKKQTFSYPKKYFLTTTDKLTMSDGKSPTDYIVFDPENSNTIAQISQNANQTQYSVNVKDLAMLNYALIPNSLYKVDNATYTTDKLGRRIKVQQTIDARYKHKSSLNIRRLKPKTFILDQSYKPLALADLKYNGTISYINIIPIKKTRENKQALQEIKKSIKTAVKEVKSFSVVTSLNYSDTSSNPSSILVSINGKQVYLQLK